MRYEDREICFAPVFQGHGFIQGTFLTMLIFPVILAILAVIFVVVVVFTLGRARPREEVACAMKRIWYETRNCRTGNDDSTIVL